MQGPSQKQLRRHYDEAANRAASFVRREYPHLSGILVHGSVARGEPGPFSDIDMLGVTNRKKKPADFSYFDGDIYVGVGFLSVAELEKELTDPRAFFWPRGSAKTTRILYDPRGIFALNDLSIISENYLWHQILNVRKRPEHLGADYPLALGIKGTRDTKLVYRSAMRLCGETLRLVRAEFGEKAKHTRFRELLAVPLEKHG